MWSRSPAKAASPVAQIARDFGISESCLARWLKIADVEDGSVPLPTSRASGSLEADRELRKRNRLLEQENEVLRRAAAYFARDTCPKMMYPLVLDLAADGIPVAVTCRVLGFSTPGLLPVARQPGHRAATATTRYLINAAFDVHHDDPSSATGSSPTSSPTPAIDGRANRVWRLCSQQRLWSVHAKKRGLNRQARPAGPRRPRRARLHRRAAPNQLWLTDITEHPTGEGKLYLCAIKDVYSNRIVGYSIDSRMKSRSPSPR